MATTGETDWHGLFQQAALEPSRWPLVLQALADATGSARGQLIGIGGRRTIDFNWVTSLGETALKRFAEIDGGSPVVNFRVAADVDGKSAAIVFEADYDRVRPSLRTDDYLDFARDNDIPFGCHTALTTGADGLVGLAVLRAASDRRSTQAQREEFARAAQGARAAVQLQGTIEHQGAALIAGTFDAMTLDCLLIGRDGRVGGISVSAERYLATQGLVSVSGGRLTSRVPAVARQIDLALRSVLNGTARATIRLTDGVGPTLDLFALQARDWSLSFQPRAIAVLRDPETRVAAAGDAMATMFGFSEAEKQIATMLGRGIRRERIAAERGVSILTLRTQIKSLYEKSGCVREGEFIALFASLMA